MQAAAVVTQVLLVDDHDLFASSLALALDREPDLCVVERVGTVRAAVRAVSTVPLDVVLMDVGLPDGSGIDAVRELKRMLPSLQAVMLTATDDDATLLAAVDAGASGFVTKSSSVEELLQAIRAAAAGEAVISPAVLARLLPRLRRDHRGLGDDLSPREVEVLGLVAEGLTNADIAGRLGLSVNTIRNHVQSLLAKLGVHSKLEALAVATKEGLLPAS